MGLTGAVFQFGREGDGKGEPAPGGGNAPHVHSVMAGAPGSGHLLTLGEGLALLPGCSEAPGPHAAVPTAHGVRARPSVPAAPSPTELDGSPAGFQDSKAPSVGNWGAEQNLTVRRVGRWTPMARQGRCLGGRLCWEGPCLRGAPVWARSCGSSRAPHSQGRPGVRVEWRTGQASSEPRSGVALHTCFLVCGRGPPWHLRGWGHGSQ